MHQSPDDLSAALDPAGVPGQPKPVLQARAAYLRLRSARFPQADTVTAAHALTVGALLGEAGVRDVRPEAIDVADITTARARQRELEDRQQVLRDAASQAGPRFAQTVAAHKAELIDAIRRQHRAVLEALADAGGEEAGQVGAAVQELERLRLAVPLVDGRPIFENTWMQWTASLRLYDDSIRPGARTSPGMDTRPYGRPGTPQMYVALLRAGCPLDEFWAPTADEADRLADELLTARKLERQLAGARR